jgi:hypothetical protein
VEVQSGKLPSVSYFLDRTVEKKLTRPLLEVDKGVVRILAEIAPSSSGEDWLYFRVVLKDDPRMTATSDVFSQRIRKISTELRNRAAHLNVPMFASVSFVAESELPRQKRKIA